MKLPPFSFWLPEGTSGPVLQFEGRICRLCVGREVSRQLTHPAARPAGHLSMAQGRQNQDSQRETVFGTLL